MNIPTTKIDGVEYELSTKLIVAFRVQGAHNHKPYLEVFQGLAEMSLEEQIEILFIAFAAQNPEAAKRYDKNKFQEYYLNNYNLKEMMSQLQGVVRGIMGEEEPTEADTAATEAASVNG